MEDMGHPWPQNCSWHWIHNLCAKFQHSSMFRNVSRTTLSSSVTWRTLRVPDQRHGGHGLSLISELFLIPNMCAKYQHSSMIRSVSRTSCPWWGYLEDIDGSWQETWRTGSSLTLWITFRNIPWKFHVIIFIFGWDTSVSYHGNKKVTDTETDKKTDR